MMGRVLGFQKILDKQASRPLISKLDVGESGYVVPWMIRVTKKGGLFIRDTNIDPTSGGTVCVKVTRISDAKDGYEIDLNGMYDEADVTFVEDEKNLSSGIVCGSKIHWIKICNIREIQLTHKQQGVLP